MDYSKAFVLAAAVGCVCLGASALLDQITVTQEKQKKEQEYDEAKQVIKQVIDKVIQREEVELPDLEGRCWLTVIQPLAWQLDQETLHLKNMLNTDSILSQMKSRCQYREMNDTDIVYQELFRPVVGSNVPALVLTRWDGTLIYKVSRGTIPSSGEQMASDIRDRCGPRPSPSPEDPLTPPDIGPLPDTVDMPSPPDAPGGDEESALMLAILAIGSYITSAFVTSKNN